jgi:cytochrome c oxidase subunit 2
MKNPFRYVFPLVMIGGILLSTVVIVAAAQAAAFGTPTTPAASLDNAKPAASAAEGRMLFVAKGCIVCHNNDRIAENRSLRQFFSIDTPSLSRVKIDPDYLRRWLRDPGAMKPGVDMPDLQLTEMEIESLVAFLVASEEEPQ